MCSRVDAVQSTVTASVSSWSLVGCFMQRSVLKFTRSNTAETCTDLLRLEPVGMVICHGLSELYWDINNGDEVDSLQCLRLISEIPRPKAQPIPGIVKGQSTKYANK